MPVTHPIPMYSGPDRDPADIYSVYVVLNGSLGMTPGKAAAQSFHIGWVLNEVMRDEIEQNDIGWGSRTTADWERRYLVWMQEGRRVVTRLAETPYIWERAKAECDGWLTKDEGMTEVEHGSETAMVTIPYLRTEIPKILHHKRLQLYKG